VKAVDKLAVTDGGVITLDAGAGSPTMGPAVDSTAELRFTHNEGSTKQIAAEVKVQDAPNPATNDIVLKVSVLGGTGPKTLYNNAGSTGAQAVFTGISAGALSQKTVTYSAECTPVGTGVRADTEFAFVVTFTSLDE
jgi:hypothetical protein